MRALVTGGAGFIGSHVVRRLVTTGWDVRVLDDLSTGHLSNLGDLVADVEVEEGDIRDLDSLSRILAGCDVVFHLAALPSVPRSIAAPLASHDVNATGTLNVLVAAREAGVGRVVSSSSSSIYGANPELPKQEDMLPLPISPYAVSKLAAESYCRSFHAIHGLEVVALRYFNVFGPRQDPNSQYSAVIPKFVQALQRGESPVIFGDGEQSRDFTYVENVVNGNLAAAQATGVGGRVYNIACGGSVTLNELTEKLRAEVGAEVEIQHGPARPGDVRDSLADISAARRDLGYEPTVDLDEGIRRTVRHYLERAQGSSASQWSNGSRALNGFHGVNSSRAGRTTEPAAPAGAEVPAGSHGGEGISYLITGGAGFIGSHLTEKLLERDSCERIVILDDLSTGSYENIAHLVEDPRVSFVRGSVTDADTVDRLMNGADQCIHLASAVGVQMIVNEPLDTLMRSVRGSNVVMHAATRSGVRVLFSSTSEVYGKQSHKVLSEQDDLIFGSPSKGRWTYAIAKSFGEALIHGYHRQRGANATIVRLFNCVGPRQTGTYGMVLPRFVRQALAGDDLTVYGDGSQTRCFTHVQDTVAALIALSDHPEATGRTFNIGSSNAISIGELARRVIARCGSESGVVGVPYEEAYGSGFEELGTRVPDTTALSELTGWQATLTINDAIDDVIAHERLRLSGHQAAGRGQGPS